MSADFAALREGDELPILEVQPSLEMSIRFCGLAWAFPQFFWDPDAARARGMPGTLVPGPVKLGLMYRAIDQWLGDAGFVRQVGAAQRRPDITGQPLVIAGRVARVYEEDGKRRADLELAVINEEGQPSVRGFAVVEERR